MKQKILQKLWENSFKHCTLKKKKNTPQTI